MVAIAENHKDDILLGAEEYPEINVRRISTMLPDISITSVWSTHRKHKGSLYPFHSIFKKKHAMLKSDFAARVQF